MNSSSLRRAVLRRPPRFLIYGLTLLLAAGPASAVAWQENPTVVAGSAGISGLGTGHTVINQSSNRAIVNWDSFSINPGNSVQFIQPGVDAAILNRVTGGDPSQLLGSMTANGQVFLINPNGIIVGPNAHIDVGGFIASTLDVSNAQFMQGGDLTFAGNSTASVINRGVVRALEGNIYLIGANVQNHGTLTATNGNIGLAAGSQVRLVDAARPYLVVEANANSFSGDQIINTGVIQAAQAELIANGGNVYALAINNTGKVRANGFRKENGRVFLTSDGGNIRSSGDLVAKNTDGTGGQVTVNAGRGGKAEVTGTIDVSGTRGGSAKILGSEIDLAGAAINASGIRGGGRVNIGGSFQGRGPLLNARNTSVDADSIIDVSAITAGDGGVVVVWSDHQTQFSGTVVGRGGAQGGQGGFAEISSRQNLGFDGTAHLGSQSGRNGKLLLDPTNVVIADIGGDITPAAIIAALAEADVIIHTSGDAGEEGDISVTDPVLYNSSNRLSLIAHDDIFASASIQNRGDGTLDLIAGWDGTTGVTGTPPAPLAQESFDVDAILDSGAFGATGGNVLVGGSGNSQAVAVGTQLGTNTTHVVGYNVEVIGSTTTSGAFAQIGFHSTSSDLSTSIHSTIHVDAKNDVRVVSGSQAGTFAVIGHGHPFYLGRAKGEITVLAGRDVQLTGDSAPSRQLAQIGHIAPYSVGNINVLAQRDVAVLVPGDEVEGRIGHSADVESQFHEPFLTGQRLAVNDVELGSGFGILLAGDINIGSPSDPEAPVSSLTVSSTGDDSIAQVGHYGRLNQLGGFLFTPFESRVVIAGDISVTTSGANGNSLGIEVISGMPGSPAASAGIGHWGSLFDVGRGVSTELTGAGLNDLLAGHGIEVSGLNGDSAFGIDDADFRIENAVFVVGDIATTSRMGTSIQALVTENSSWIGHVGQMVQAGRAPSSPISDAAQNGDDVFDVQEARGVWLTGDIRVIDGQQIIVEGGTSGFLSATDAIAQIGHLGEYSFELGFNEFIDATALEDGESQPELITRLGPGVFLLGDIEVDGQDFIRVAGGGLASTEGSNVGRIGHSGETSIDLAASFEGEGEFDEIYLADFQRAGPVVAVGGIWATSGNNIDVSAVGTTNDIQRNVGQIGHDGRVDEGLPLFFAEYGSIPDPVEPIVVNLPSGVALIGDISVSAQGSVRVGASAPFGSNVGNLAIIGHNGVVNDFTGGRIFSRIPLIEVLQLDGDFEEELAALSQLLGVEDLSVDLNVGPLVVAAGNISVRSAGMNAPIGIRVSGDDQNEIALIGHQGVLNQYGRSRGEDDFDFENNAELNVDVTLAGVFLIGDIGATVSGQTADIEVFAGLFGPGSTSSLGQIGHNGDFREWVVNPDEFGDFEFARGFETLDEHDDRLSVTVGPGVYVLGDIDVRSTNDVLVDSLSFPFEAAGGNVARIGHQGRTSVAPADIDSWEGEYDDEYGHPGIGRGGPVNIFGNVYVSAARDVRVSSSTSAGSSGNNLSQIGHFGSVLSGLPEDFEFEEGWQEDSWDESGLVITEPSWVLLGGQIEVEAQGALNVVSRAFGDVFNRGMNRSQIGHYGQLNDLGSKQPPLALPLTEILSLLDIKTEHDLAVQINQGVYLFGDIDTYSGGPTSVDANGFMNTSLIGHAGMATVRGMTNPQPTPNAPINLNIGPGVFIAGDIQVVAEDALYVRSEPGLNNSARSSTAQIGHQGEFVYISNPFQDNNYEVAYEHGHEGSHPSTEINVGPGVFIYGDIHVTADALDLLAISGNDGGRNVARIGHSGVTQLEFQFSDQDDPGQEGAVGRVSQSVYPYGSSQRIARAGPVVILGNIDARINRAVEIKSDGAFVGSRGTNLAQFGHFGQVTEPRLPFGSANGVQPYSDSWMGDGGRRFDLPSAVALVGDLDLQAGQTLRVVSLGSGAEEGGDNVALIGHNGVLDDQNGSPVKLRIPLGLLSDYFDIGSPILDEYGSEGLTLGLGPGVYVLGDINTVSGRDTTVETFGVANVSQIGHQGFVQATGVSEPTPPPTPIFDLEGVVIFGDITVNAGLEGMLADVRVLSGSHTGIGNRAQIGHHGEFDYRFANGIPQAGQITDGEGHGEHGLVKSFRGTLIKGNVDVFATRDVIVRSSVMMPDGQPAENLARIGHDGATRVAQNVPPQDDDPGDDGRDRVAATSRSVESGSHHGQASFNTQIAGDITVVSTRDVMVQAYDVGGTAQVGHDALAMQNLSDTGPETGRDGYGSLRSATLMGNIRVAAPRDIQLTSSSEGSEAHIGHGRGGGVLYHKLAGDILALAGRDFRLEATAGSNTQVGHGGPWSRAEWFDGDIIIGFDQLNPVVDEGGRFFMDSYSRIDAGAETVGGVPRGRVSLFGTRRDNDNPAGPMNELGDGAFFNGVLFNSALPLATLGPSGWNTNTEFITWDHENWQGFLVEDLLNGVPLPYQDPFVFYYPGRDDTPEIPQFPHDQLERYVWWAETVFLPWDNTAGDAFYGQDDRESGDEILSTDSSYKTFGQQ